MEKRGREMYPMIHTDSTRVGNQGLELWLRWRRDESAHYDSDFIRPEGRNDTMIRTSMMPNASSSDRESPPESLIVVAERWKVDYSENKLKCTKKSLNKQFDLAISGPLSTQKALPVEYGLLHYLSARFVMSAISGRCLQISDQVNAKSLMTIPDTGLINTASFPCESTTTFMAASKTTLLTLPPEILALLPHHLANIEDFKELSSTCRPLRAACSSAPPHLILRLAAASSRVFFRPDPYFLVAATAKQIGRWALLSEENTYELRKALRGGIEGLFDLCVENAGLSMEDIRW